ncbi:MAG: EamA family transporter, partial [Rickettsiales bacterium]|nr:EamA family transporter [Rickettsiales bacterium]
AMAAAKAAPDMTVWDLYCGVGSLSLLAWMGACTVPILFLLSFVFEYDHWPAIFSPTLPAILGVGYTVLCSTILAYGLWYFLLTKYTVSQVTPYSLLTPVFGIAAGQMFFSEELTAQTVIGGILTLVGVAIITLRRPKTIPLGEAV